MVKKKESKKKKGMYCYQCYKEIDFGKEKYVSISTCNRGKNLLDECEFFHFDCFVKYWNDAVLKKATSIVGEMQSKAIEFFDAPMIKGLLSQVGGSDMALNMLKTSLGKKEDCVADVKEKIKRQIQNDRRKKSGNRNRNRNRKSPRNPKARKSKMH